MQVDSFEGWTHLSYAWRECGTTEISKNEDVLNYHVNWEAGREKKHMGV